MVPNDGLVAAFEAGTLDPAGFDHRAHVRLAWAMLGRWPRWEAVSRVAAGLRALAGRHGHPQRYHETMTVGFCLIIDARRRDGESWASFAARNGELVDDGRAVLHRHWSPELLASDHARTRFALPDRGGPRDG